MFTNCTSYSIPYRTHSFEDTSSSSSNSSFNKDKKKIKGVLEDIIVKLNESHFQPLEKPLDIPSLIESVTYAQELVKQLKKRESEISQSSSSSESLSPSLINDLLGQLKCTDDLPFQHQKEKRANLEFLPETRMAGGTYNALGKKHPYNRENEIRFSDESEHSEEDSFRSSQRLSSGYYQNAIDMLNNINFNELSDSNTSPKPVLEAEKQKKSGEQTKRVRRLSEPSKSNQLEKNKNVPKLIETPEEKKDSKLKSSLESKEKSSKVNTRSRPRPNLHTLPLPIPNPSPPIAPSEKLNSIYRWEGSFKSSITKNGAEVSLPQQSPTDCKEASPNRRNSPLDRFKPSSRNPSPRMGNSSSSSPRVQISNLINERKFFSAVLGNEESCKHWIENIINKSQLKTRDEIKDPIAINIKARIEVQSKAINNYGLELCKRTAVKLIPLPNDPHTSGSDEEFGYTKKFQKNAESPLEEGLFEFSVLNERREIEKIQMVPYHITPAVYDKNARRIFSSVENSVMCEFIEVPGFSNSNEITDISQLRSKPTLVLTSGCGLGMHSSNAAQRAAKVVKMEVDNLLGKLKKKKNPITPASIIKIQLKAINVAHEILRGNPKIYGATEIVVENIIGRHLIVTSVGNAKTFIVRKMEDKLHCFELKYKQQDSSIGNFQKNSLQKLACAVLHLEEGDHVVVCSKGAYDNLDPLIIEDSASDWSKPEERSRFMANKLKSIFNVCGIEKAWSAAFTGYIQAMAFKKNKINLVPSLLFDPHFRSHSSSIESDDTSNRIQTISQKVIDKKNAKDDKISKEIKKPSFERLININPKELKKASLESLINGNGKPGFATFAILSYTSHL